ncbi:amidohydrolase family protein [Kribbella sp. NPDC004536]|uniref:amidohydrolase family protein n=1 Tax=Kribbella sp. NPDC004536 TaxID=3364106 RepID=UPI0036B05BA9
MIDAHVHVWNPATGFGWLRGPLRRSFDLHDLQTEWASAGIADVAAILVEAGRGDDAETESLLELAARTSAVVGVVGSARLSDSGALDRLQAMIQSPNGRWLRGIRERLDGPGLPDAVAEVADALADHGLVLELNVATDRLRDVVEICAAAGPRVPIVIDHVGAPPGSLTGRRSIRWTADLAEVARHRQVSIKLSGLGTQLRRLRPDQRADLIRFAVGLFGPQRAMLGSDWPVCTLVGDWRDAVDSVVQACADQPGEAIEWITGRTAALIYQLKPCAG